jgi:hypothetical protein
VIVTVAWIDNKMFFLSVNIEGFQRDGAQLFCSNPVINGSQAILADIKAHNFFFPAFIFAVSRFFQGNGPNRDRDGPKNKQRNGPIVTVATI